MKREMTRNNVRFIKRQKSKFTEKKRVKMRRQQTVGILKDLRIRLIESMGGE